MREACLALRQASLVLFFHGTRDTDFETRATLYSRFVIHNLYSVTSVAYP